MTRHAAYAGCLRLMPLRVRECLFGVSLDRIGEVCVMSGFTPVATELRTSLNTVGSPLGCERAIALIDLPEQLPS